MYVCFAFPSGAKCLCPFPHVLLEVLLLVSGEVHQVPQQECIHHGQHYTDFALCCVPCILLIAIVIVSSKFISFTFMHLKSNGRPLYFLKPADLLSMTDRHLWEELLCLSQKCFHAAHEKCHKVGEGGGDM